MINNVNSANFEFEVLSADLPVLVDFYSDTCNPCKMLSPIIAELADKHREKIKVLKLNVDDSPDIAASYGIFSIPTLIMFENGKIAKTSVGLKNLTTLEDVFELKSL